MQDLWTKCLARVREEVSPQAFDRWFSGTRPVGREGGALTVEAPDPFSLDTLRTRYSGLVEAILQQEGGQELSLRWAAAANGAAPPPALRPAPAAPAAAPVPAKPDFLNPKYTFGTFVVGGSNEFAHACALRVAEAPGRSLNPLFFYGGVGLGKTHLLHAIAHRFLEAQPGARVHYTSSENFINELISLAGGENIAGKAAQPWLNLPDEYVIAKAPRVIIEAGMGAEREQSAKRWQDLKSIPAVQEQRVYYYRSDKILRPGPRIGEGLEEIARLVHPECFAESQRGLNPGSGCEGPRP
ncbi:MAG: ABC transporter substrate-binding protein [Candidatus Tectomicrobia bacterium]|uniref:ABC transporter substrate-binding protein n=1 Tax=Tectimicrobiota bacterium TaxID=2528274 RepID=A0A933E9F7_UNCTE|nr:ABC transporter substrate-binding protein [Candidatus Tectomicrobia bacterium]